MNKIFSLGLILSFFALSAFAGEEIKGDLEWQRVNLESTLNERAKAILSAYSSGHQVIVQTSITMKATETKPHTGTVDANSAQKTAENEVMLGKLDMSAPTLNVVEDSFFTRIQKVTINSYVPKFVLDAGKDQIEKQLKAIAKISGQTQISVTVEELVTPKVVVQEEPWSIRKWLIEFKELLGLVLGALVLSFFAVFIGFIVMGAYKKIETKKLAVMEARNTLEAEKSKKAEEHEELEKVSTQAKEAGATDDSEDWGDIDGVDSGFNRFKDILATDPDAASGMVRQWIQHPAKNGPLEALLTLPQVVDSKALMGLFSLLTLDERKTWKTTLSERISGPSPGEVKCADRFISREIVELLIIPHQVSDVEFKKLLQSLTFKDCVSLVMNHTQYAPILINYLPTAIVSRLYTLLPKEKADEITLLSVKFKESDFAQQLGEVKKIVQSIVTGTGAAGGTPFVDNISELLRTVSYARERSIWTALLDAGEVNVIQVAATKVFPCHLVTKLPAELLKRAIDRFNTAKKADFISGLPEQDRKFYLEVCSKGGTKLREMLDYELNQIETNEVRKKKNSKYANQLQKEYLDIVRSFVISDEHVQDIATELVNHWINQATQNDSNKIAA